MYEGGTGVYHDQHMIGVDMNKFFNDKGANSSSSRDSADLGTLGYDGFDVVVAHIDAGKPTKEGNDNAAASAAARADSC